MNLTWRVLGPGVVIVGLVLAGCSGRAATGEVVLPTFTATGSPAVASANSTPSTVPPAAGSEPSTAVPVATSPIPSAISAPSAFSAPSGSTSGPGTPSPSPSVPAAATARWSSLPTEATGPNRGVRNGVVVIGKPGRTAGERAAVAAVTAYWTLEFAAFSTATLDRAALTAAMTSGLVPPIQKYVAGLRTRGAHTVGWTVIDVRLLGAGTSAGSAGTAVVSGCGVDGSYDVDDATGRALQAPTGDFTMDAAVHKVGSAWLVTSMRVSGGPCSVPG